jgi:hypothetical protein
LVASPYSSAPKNLLVEATSRDISPHTHSGLTARAGPTEYFSGRLTRRFDSGVVGLLY